MATLISHFFNEEFLLPSWLKHHLIRFEHGILINFDSTDSSIEIIKDLAPNWKVINSVTPTFDAAELDLQISKIESAIDGQKIALTTTEFFLGNPDEIEGNSLVPSIELINMPNDQKFDLAKPWHEQRHWGYHYHNEFPGRPGGRGRILHNTVINYSPGRHFEVKIGGPFLIYRVANCLIDERMIERKLQIQNKISKSDIKMGYGVQHHNFGKGLLRENVVDQEKLDRELATDLSEDLQGALLREKLSFNVEMISPNFHTSLMNELDHRRKNLDLQKLALNELEKKSVSLEELVDSLNFKCKELQDEKNSIQQSLSWRLTRPLRSLNKFLKSKVKL